MKLQIMILAAALSAAIPALAQAPASGSKEPAPAEHQPDVSPGTPPAPAAPAEKPDPAKDAAIRHLMELTQTAKLDDNVSAYFTDHVRAIMSQNLSADQLPKFMDAFKEKFAAKVPPGAVTDAVVPIYAHYLTTEDIQGLIQFYGSPVGQHVVKVMPKVDKESTNTGLEMGNKAAMETLHEMSSDYPELKQMLAPENAPSGAAPSPAPSPTPAPEAPAPAPAAPKQ